jgi:hypothetical protein
MNPTTDDGLGTRHATLQDLAALLRGQEARKVDVIAPASAIHAEHGLLVLNDSVPDLTSDGVGMTAGSYRPTGVCDAGIADKLAIPAAYLRRMREQAPALYDQNVNGWLSRDDRSFMIRCLRADGPGPAGTGVARAWLSGSYKVIDNLDVLVAALDGIRQAGYPVEVEECDLTERRMYVKVRCDAVQVMAPLLMSGYRSPFTGASGADNPFISGGFVLTNSETGCGACALAPRMVAQVCRNGMTVSRDAKRMIHLGERQQAGITWAGDTGDKSLALLTSMVRDTVTSILDPAYVQRAVRAMEKEAGHPVTEPVEAVKVISTRLRYTEAQQADILGHFIKGGDLTAGGILHAVTSAAQVQDDADDAWDLENTALEALCLAAAL